MRFRDGESKCWAFRESFLDFRQRLSLFRQRLTGFRGSSLGLRGPLQSALQGLTESHGPLTGFRGPLTELRGCFTKLRGPFQSARQWLTELRQPLTETQECLTGMINQKYESGRKSRIIPTTYCLTASLALSLRQSVAPPSNTIFAFRECYPHKYPISVMIDAAKTKAIP